MTRTIERLEWILDDEEIASYIREKEQAYEDFYGERLPWNVPRFSVEEVGAAIMALIEVNENVDFEDEEIIQEIEEYLGGRSEDE